MNIFHLINKINKAAKKTRKLSKTFSLSDDDLEYIKNQMLRNNKSMLSNKRVYCACKKMAKTKREFINCLKKNKVI
jgi:hypothetical protein